MADSSWEFLKIENDQIKHCETIIIFCGTKEQLKSSEWKNLVTGHKFMFAICNKNDSISLHYHLGLNFINLFFLEVLSNQGSVQNTYK